MECFIGDHVLVTQFYSCGMFGKKKMQKCLKCGGEHKTRDCNVEKMHLA